MPAPSGCRYYAAGSRAPASPHHCPLRPGRRISLTGFSGVPGLPANLPPPRIARMRSRKSYNSTCKMDLFRKKLPNHTEIAYREAVSKLKYLLAESYAPKITIVKPMAISKRCFKESAPQPEDYADEVDMQSVMSDASKREPSTRGRYFASRLGQTYSIPQTLYAPSGAGDRVTLPPGELSTFIERQEEYIEQLERESQYCREELKSLVEKVREYHEQHLQVVAENEALQDKNKSGFFKSALDGYGEVCADSSSRKPCTTVASSKPLEGPSIVFESRISELEAQLTQARLELRKAREEKHEHLERLSERKDEAQLHLELERALREKRELEARTEELQRELGKLRSRDADVELKSQRALDVAQQAEYEKAQAEGEVRRLKEELERRQEKLREALQESNRRVIEEKQQVERRFSQQMEQLSADVATHWEAASKSHLETEKQRREIAELKRELAQKNQTIDELKKELQAKTAKLQEELSEALAEREASQEEIATLKSTAERNERQARQEQTRLQTEINSHKMRLERADADLLHARRENLRLTEEIAALEKEINMNKIMQETRVSGQPAKLEKAKDEKDRDKELASLISDLENKQAETVAGLRDSLNKQASLVSRLTADCQSLTQRLEANDQQHKQEMASLQNNIERLSCRIRQSLELEEPTTENQTQVPTEPTPSELTGIQSPTDDSNTTDPSESTSRQTCRVEDSGVIEEIESPNLAHPSLQQDNQESQGACTEDHGGGQHCGSCEQTLHQEHCDQEYQPQEEQQCTREADQYDPSADQYPEEVGRDNDVHPEQSFQICASPREEQT